MVQSGSAADSEREPKYARTEGAAATATSVDALQRRIDAARLPEGFVLTDYTRLKGCSCKIPQDHLLALLRTAAKLQPGSEDVGMDCSIVEVKSPALKRYLPPSEKAFLVSTTDFFFPSVEDPFTQGEIGAANVLSDMYAMGISEIDNVLMLLAASVDMEAEESDAVTRDMMRGFVSKCEEAGTNVTGGQSVRNPWPLIGGVAMSTCFASEMLIPNGMVPGDVLVLTKPLGTQIAVGLKQWLHRPSPLYKRVIEGVVAKEDIESLYGSAVRSMARLNKAAAIRMKQHEAHAATDVTGFGLLGHARNLSLAQPRRTKIVIDTLPVLAHAARAEQLMNDKYKLRYGLSAETSGGLLIAFGTVENARAFIDAMAKAHGQPCWIVGRVTTRDPEDDVAAVVVESPSIIHVPY